MTEVAQNDHAARWRLAGWATGGLMVATALTAAQFVGEGGWVDTLAQTGGLILGLGLAVELVLRTPAAVAYRIAIGLALGAALLLVWVNGAVGIIGSEDNPANLMFGAVLAVGAIGSVIARLRPDGMALALFATALTQALVAAIALVGQMGGPSNEPFEIVAGNGFFVALFVGSAVLFRKAAGARLHRDTA